MNLSIENISPLSVKGAWGIGNTRSLSERLICASLDEPLPPETAQDCTKTPDALHRAFFIICGYSNKFEATYNKKSTEQKFSVFVCLVAGERFEQR